MADSKYYIDLELKDNKLSNAIQARTVLQTAHGFTVGSWVYYNGTAYAMARADLFGTCASIGVVSDVLDSNTFVLCKSGYCKSWSGLTAGATYYLSQATAGSSTATKPTSGIVRVLFVATSVTAGWIDQYNEIATVDSNNGVLLGNMGLATKPANLNMAIQFGLVGSGVSNGFNNVFIGSSSTVNTGSNVTAVGVGAAAANTNGNDSVYVGHFAGKVNTTGYSNVFVGKDAGTSNTSGYQNAFVGLSAGYYNTTGFCNTYYGQSAGFTNTAGSYNTAVGYQAGALNTVGDNSFFGVQAGYNNTTGSLNVFFGELAGYNNNVGSANTFIGLKAGYNVTTGGNNIVIGSSNCDAANTTGASNTLIGTGLTGYGNVFNTVILSDGANRKNLIMDAASARFTDPIRPPQYTLAALPSASTAGVGAIAYATNGTKFGDSTGTGSLVFSNGTSWSTVQQNNTPLLSVNKSTTQAVAAVTSTRVTMPNLTVDTRAGWSSINSIYTIPTTGYYQINAFVRLVDGSVYTNYCVDVNTVDSATTGFAAWTDTSNSPSTKRSSNSLNQVRYYIAGDLARLIVYADAAVTVQSAQLSILLIR